MEPNFIFNNFPNNNLIYHLTLSQQSIHGRQSTPSTKRSITPSNVIYLRTNDFRVKAQFLIDVLLLNEFNQIIEDQNLLIGTKILFGVSLSNTTGYHRFEFGDLGIMSTGRYKLRFTLSKYFSNQNPIVIKFFDSNVLVVYSSRTYSKVIKNKNN
ncbi:uncharacterized protein ASCRUDRAFT_81956 [Ascoidea rubescens DSM 1968]|uniref:Velvet domain-containing protein n=1 Tax=Ascoidea rubescens DSM 1968 TaxID=1344418 RepID=A0A1D2VDK0_9ASCO|nr:hypothetical protein ASCRUDRAFT_81956 [Ascoidea rubescens DSM 1968]ODV59679.1 hypothetical protein ASCRUDRAFT_81956 [Ascoidea rubescens DSM 1968]